MIDPDNVIDFKRTDFELQEFMMFCILVAGKTAKTTAKLLADLIDWLGYRGPNVPPLQTLHDVFISRRSSPGIQFDLAENLKAHGFGCHSLKAKALLDVASAIIDRGLDLRTCSVEALEVLHGVGPKTARYFVVYSRENSSHLAILDRHILKHLAELGFDVPKTTPSGKVYAELEKKFVEHVAKSGMTMQEYDLAMWKSKRK